MIFHLSNSLFISVVTLVAFFSFETSGQDTSKTPNFTVLESAEIKWMNQWPFPVDSNKSIGRKGWLQNLVFGKESVELSKPSAVLYSDTDILWVLDQGNNNVFRVDEEHTNSPRILKKKNTDFLSLVGMCFFKNNEILFTDSYLNKIYIANPENKFYYVLNDSLGLKQPTGIAFSTITNEIWIVETAAHKISILNEKGEFLRSIGKRGSASGEFNYPTNIWIDKEGNVYIIDSMNFRVQVLDKDGNVTSVFGSIGDASGYFARPKGIATDSYGNIYISDALFNVVQIFDIKGNFLYSFGSQGHDYGEFWMPSGLFIDDANNIYVADSYNSRIQVFQLTNCVMK